MHWVNRVFRDFRLYAVTDLNSHSQSGILRAVESAYVGGADIIQLRSKNLPMSEKVRLGLAISKIANRHKKLYFVNDSLSLALLTSAHGLHVGQDDLPPKEVRRLCKKMKQSLLLGLSTHSDAQAKRAQTEPIDYFAVGPVFATPTKPDYRSVGLGLVERVGRFAKKPWVAIGGIDLKNLDLVLEKGASRVAVVRAIFSAKSPELACRHFTQKLRGETDV
ncbi:MAG TPA: thiamine phosphate synthase [Candidatus Omnitrophica bacterium]|nr:thiamine phosphate synthase [Candidatus Omnitrophota bacterium]